MLVLARRCGEKIVINDNIVIEVVAVRSGGTVSLGITAPTNVAIARSELLDRSKLPCLSQDRGLGGGGVLVPAK